MKNFQVTKVLMILVIILGGLYFLCPEYLRNTIVYQSANIDDHKIFDNRTVIAAEHYSWEEFPGFKTKAFPIQ
jgi:hypothetical protein